MTVQHARHQPPTFDPVRVDNFQTGYFKLIERIIEGPSLSNSPRGNAEREILCVDLVLTNPRNRLVLTAARRANMAFQLAEVLWYLSGSDELAMLAYYAPSVRKYSADGKTLGGTAYGPRIFAWPGGPYSPAINQWNAAADEIRSDPDTKRAVLAIYNPIELTRPHNPDVACTLALHFIRRENRLHCFTTMRGNDAYRGMVSDIFSFTMLHEMMAVELGLSLGTYYHRVNSLHLYDSDYLRAVSTHRAWLDQGATAPASMDALPQVPMASWLPHVLEAERTMRLSRRPMSTTEILNMPLPAFWAHVVGALSDFVRWKEGVSSQDSRYHFQPSDWRQMHENYVAPKSILTES